MTSRHRTHPAWALAPLGLLMSIGAGAGELLSEAEYFSDLPVVLSASRLSQPVNRAPAAVTVITRDMIEASGFRHLVDVLRLVPGFVVGWSGGNTPAATYLGLAEELPNRMQIMVDGRSVYNPAYGHTTWRGIPLTLDEVDHIEVVRGPNAANDGLNSVLGTVHIYTRHSALTQGALADVALGNKQFREMNLRYGAETDSGSWRLSLLGRQDERHGVAWDHASDLMASFRADYQPTRQDDVMLQLGVSRGDWRGTNVAQLRTDDQEARHLAGHVNAQWRRALTQGRAWTLQLHHTFDQNAEAILLDPPLDPLSGDYRSGASALQFAYQDQGDPDLRTHLGGEYRLNRIRLPALLGREGYVRDHIYRLSGALEWNPSPQWVWHAAAMLENHSDTHSTNLSPRLALNWLPDRQHAFRLGFSKGVSALSLYANNTDIKLRIGGTVVDQDTLSMGTLEPEKIDSAELGYLFSKPEWHLNLDMRAFHNRLYDIVSTDRIPYPDANGKARTYKNMFEASQRGLEYQLKWQPRPHSWLLLSQSWTSRDSDYPKNYVPSVPPETLSLQADHRLAGFDISLGYYRIGEIFWIGAPRDRLSKYDRLDLRLARAWKTTDGRVELALVLQSPIGKEYERFSDYLYEEQVFRRQGYLSLKYEFH